MGDSYNDVPWWAALVAALFSAVAAAIGTVIALRGGTPSIPGAPAGMGAILSDTVAYTPHILLLFGVLADIFTMEGVYSIPSLVGLLSIVGNYVLQFLWSGLELTIGNFMKLLTAAPIAAVSAPQAGGSTYDGCTIQGMGGLESPYAPQVLVVTATVFFYYMIDLIVNRGAAAAAGTIVTFAIVYGVQAWTIRACDFRTGSAGFFWKAMTALAEGLLFGGTAYGTVQVAAPDRLPSSVLRKVAPKYTASDLTKNAAGQMVGPDGVVYTIGLNGIAIPAFGAGGAPASGATGATGNVSSGAAAVASCPAGTTAQI
jgi:hypothetical protein